ncbi:MAG: hypothetical protein PHI98_14835 [Eubacteriales bacterium]|nr:hypothetical protein [Eubacteriales bacterium]
MTLDEIAALPREWLKSSEICEILGWGQYVPNLLAKQGELPFPGVFSGNRLKVPKRPFLAYMGYYTEAAYAAAMQHAEPENMLRS